MSARIRTHRLVSSVLLPLVGCLCLLVQPGTSACPAVPAEQLFPCFCFQDTSDLVCRGGDGRLIDDAVLTRVLDLVRRGENATIGKLTLSQTEVTSITDKMFAGIRFAEIVIRFNEKLGSVHEAAFTDTKDFTRNFSFGEMKSGYEGTAAGTPGSQPLLLDLSFLKGFSHLVNLFLSGVNIGHLDQQVFLPLIKQSSDPSVTGARLRFFLIGVGLECGCGNKWLFDPGSVSWGERKHFLTGSMGTTQVPLLTCRSRRTAGLLIPIRSLSHVDFADC